MPQISCIIPTYNRWPLVLEAVDSVLAQTHSDWELLVIDDGSTDGTPKLLAEQRPQVRLLRQENQGVSAARNRAAQESSGEWLAFLDSDDFWLPNKLEAQAAHLAAHPECRICQTEEVWIRRGVRVNPRHKHRKGEGDCFARSLELCVISPSSVMVRRDLWAETGGFDERLPVCEDYDLWLRITCSEQVGLLPEALVVKRGGHADQLSRSQPVMDGFRLEAMAKLLKSRLLRPEQKAQTLAELVRKCRIVVAGCRKRGKTDEAEQWSNFLAQAQNL